jgi:hypothetical protein
MKEISDYTLKLKTSSYADILLEQKLDQTLINKLVKNNTEENISSFCYKLGYLKGKIVYTMSNFCEPFYFTRKIIQMR